jgi:hypothetical protein
MSWVVNLDRERIGEHAHGLTGMTRGSGADWFELFAGPTRSSAPSFIILYPIGVEVEGNLFALYRDHLGVRAGTARGTRGAGIQ